MTPIWLAAVGVALALPVPALLARARWPHLAPGAGVILWQALALAAILAMSGAGLATALWLVAEPDPSAARVAAHVAVLALGFVVWGRFWWAAWGVWRETQRRRRRHRALVDLIGEPDLRGAAVRVLAEATPVAYCVPGRGDHRVVISQGTVDTLSDHELAAVLEHERAHLRARHDLVLEAFTVLHRAFPRVLRTDAPLHQSRVLVELMADDASRRRHGAPAVARALVELMGAPAPAGTLGAGGALEAAQIRLARLADPAPRHPGAAISAMSLSAAVLLGPTVLLAIPWMLDASAVVLNR